MIVRLERRVAELEGQAKPDGPPRMPGLKSSSGRQPPAQQQPRKQRRHGFARRRMTPTQRVEHVVENCPDCGTHLTGGWVQRTREVIELPVAPVQVTEHVYIAQDLPGVPSAAAYAPGGTGRCGFGTAAPGRQRAQPASPRYGKKRECPSAPSSGICAPYINCASARAPSSGAIHQTAQQAQPAGGWDCGPHPRQPSGPRRRNRLASEWEQRLRVDFQYPHRALLPAAGSGQGGGG